MSVRPSPPPRQDRHRDTSWGLSLEASARGLSRLSLVLAAGQRELATAAIGGANDAKRQRTEEAQAREAARSRAARESWLQWLLEEYDTLEKLLFRLAEVELELTKHETGEYQDASNRKRLEEEAELLERGIQIKDASAAQDAAKAREEAEAAAAAKAEAEEQKAAERATNERRRRAHEEATKQREEEKKDAGRHPNRQKALEDPYNWGTHLKSPADRKWWNTEGYLLAERLELAKHRERALMAAWVRQREKDEEALANDAELRRSRQRYEEILTIVTNLDDENEQVRDEAWWAYVQIAPEEVEAFRARNLQLITEQQKVEKWAEKRAKSSQSAEKAATLERIALQKKEAEAANEAEFEDQNNMVNVVRRERERKAREAAKREAKEAEREAARAAAAAETAQRRAARAAAKAEDAARPAGKRRAPQ